MLVTLVIDVIICNTISTTIEFLKRIDVYIFTCMYMLYAMLCYARSNTSHHDQLLFFCGGGFKSKADMANLNVWFDRKHASVKFGSI